ncbi:MAG TPA: rRNA adenine N-6-methyltransferase family protein [Rhizomicrobium sp.]|nr:rRNA adenine N-6-methyltransferase family protein [Rhizomicrobium sp.]
MLDSLRFIGRLATRPKTLGAVAPSSRALGRKMAQQIDVDETGPVLELGPGTGVATAALIARGIAPERITAVEYDAGFARLIAARFAGITVINGDAFRLETTLGERRGPFIGALSGVPLLNFSVSERQQFLDGVLARLKPGAPYIQFSYGLQCPVKPSPGVTVVQAAFVPFNLPPARVWVYRKG